MSDVIRVFQEEDHTGCTMPELLGLGKSDRKRLATVIRKTKGTITVGEAAEALRVPPSDAAKMLASWAKRGWILRVQRGLYVSIPLESTTSDIPIEDSWIIAERLYSPCYIGGWSAAEHWGLTEQIFRSVVVMTTRKPRDRAPILKDTKFILHTIQEKELFGLKSVWRGQIKVAVSDPARTVVDMLKDPRLAGGIRPTTDILVNFLSSEYKNTKLLVDHAKKLGIGAVFKRLGFLIEQLNLGEQEIIAACRSQMTAGNTKLDPTLPVQNLISRWKIWVPESWMKEQHD